MIDMKQIALALDQVMPKSHNHRVFVGRMSKRIQEMYLGQYFGDVVLRISEAEQTISELRKSKNGYITDGSIKYEVRATYRVNKPLLSKYDRASTRAKQTILGLLHEYRATHLPITQN